MDNKYLHHIHNQFHIFKINPYSNFDHLKHPNDAEYVTLHIKIG
jgi:hypothetical protein